MNFLEKKRLFAMNTFFKKRPSRKWTWLSPNGTAKNEIEYILISSHKHIVQDVNVLSRFKSGSNHRIFRTTLRFDFKTERTKMITRGQQIFKAPQLASLGESFQIELQNQFEILKVDENLCVDEINEKVCNILLDTTKKHLGQNRRKISKLSEETPNLIKEY